MSDQRLTTPPPWVLLAIIAVPKAERVQCECGNCGQGIFAAIHMMGMPNGDIDCWGKDCFAREAGRFRVVAMEPMFPGVGGRQLTEDEREQLRVNREQLVERFRLQFEEEKRQREMESRRKETAWRMEEENIRREEKRIMQERRAANNARMAARAAEESGASAYDLAPRLCIFCQQVTRDWWTTVGEASCKCRVCLKAGRS